jgi:hypothetical protein
MYNSPAAWQGLMPQQETGSGQSMTRTAVCSHQEGQRHASNAKKKKKDNDYIFTGELKK